MPFRKPGPRAVSHSTSVSRAARLCFAGRRWRGAGAAGRASRLAGRPDWPAERPDWPGVPTGRASRLAGRASRPAKVLTAKSHLYSGKCCIFALVYIYKPRFAAFFPKQVRFCSQHFCVLKPSSLLHLPALPIDRSRRGRSRGTSALPGKRADIFSKSSNRRFPPARRSALCRGCCPPSC